MRNRNLNIPVISEFSTCEQPPTGSSSSNWNITLQLRPLGSSSLAYSSLYAHQCLCALLIFTNKLFNIPSLGHVTSSSEEHDDTCGLTTWPGHIFPLRMICSNLIIHKHGTLRAIEHCRSYLIPHHLASGPFWIVHRFPFSKPKNSAACSWLIFIAHIWIPTLAWVMMPASLPECSANSHQSVESIRHARSLNREWWWCSVAEYHFPKMPLQRRGWA